MRGIASQCGNLALCSDKAGGRSHDRGYFAYPEECLTGAHRSLPKGFVRVMWLRRKPL